MNLNRQLLKNVIAKTCCRSGLLKLRLLWLKNDALILMFHKVTNINDPVGLSISPVLFKEQILTLKKYFDIVSLDEVLNHIGSHANLRPAVAITFDDGYADNYENAFPIIIKYDVPITIFLATGYISRTPLYWEKINSVLLNESLLSVDLLEWGGDVYLLNDKWQRLDALKKISFLIKRKPYEIAEKIIEYLIGLDAGGSYSISEMMNWNQIREMHKSGLVTFGSHTVKHHILTQMSNSAIKHELIESCSHIETEIGIRPNYLAYPNGGLGDYDSNVMNLASHVGYKAAFTTIPSPCRGCDLYSLPRIDVTQRMSCNNSGQYSPELFLSKIVGFFGY